MVSNLKKKVKHAVGVFHDLIFTQLLILFVPAFFRIFAKGGVFSESAMKFFQISKSQKKKSFQKTILSMKFNSELLLAGNLNFKLRIVFWNIFFWDLEIWKNFIALSEKKPPLESPVLVSWTKGRKNVKCPQLSTRGR